MLYKLLLDMKNKIEEILKRNISLKDKDLINKISEEILDLFSNKGFVEVNLKDFKDIKETQPLMGEFITVILEDGSKRDIIYLGEEFLYQTVRKKIISWKL